MAGVKGGQEFHFLRGQTGDAALAAQRRAKTRAKLVRDHTFRLPAEWKSMPWLRCCCCAASCSARNASR